MATPPPPPPGDRPSGRAVSAPGGGFPGGAAAAAGGAVANLPKFGPAFSVQQHEALEDEVRRGVFEAPAGFESSVPGVGPARAQDWVVMNVDASIRSMAADNTRLLLGTSVSDVAASLLIFLAEARISKNPNTLIQAMVLSVYVGYTVSRDWVRAYSMLQRPHPFESFEINGRTASAPVNGMVRDGWVSSNGMNSTALHIAGHLVVDSATGESILNKLKMSKGTIFAPPPTSVDTEQAKIMREFNATLTTKDRTAAEGFKREFARLVPIVNALFGAGGANVDAALSAAAKVSISEF